MPTIALSGSDTITINNRVLADFADGNIAELKFPTPIANAKTGKNGNSIYGLNETGQQAELTIRLIRASADDKFMNGLLAQQRINFAGTVLMTGQFIKKIGDGKGNIASDTYITSGGIFDKNVDAASNVEGDSNQSVAIYSMRFTNAPRTLT